MIYEKLLDILSMNLSLILCTNEKVN